MRTPRGPVTVSRLAVLYMAWATACGSVTPSGPDGGGDAAAGGGGGRAGGGGLDGGGGRAGGGGRGGGGAGGRGGGGAGGAGGAAHDECAKDTDCPAIACLVAPCPDVICALGGDGLHHCGTRSHPTPTACPSGGGGGPCCLSDADCPGTPLGLCVPYSFGYCGGAAPRPGNQCLYDQCQADADCTAMPKGVCMNGYPRTCAYGPCRQSADCTKSAGGACVVGLTGTLCQSMTVFCRYASDPCRSDSDCPGGGSFGKVCVPKPDLQGTTCADKQPPPP